ncbi:hypothetical protein K0817_013830 [Microbacterium sp. HD4P20]|uniref:hypothetical protein n=1 Tax=Microbacterium sp. HD4P20 TaxID=2864874 RepID=UPI001C63C3D7|nr:hypothetical protein [Microbacterium sp. HD4P20]MCP2637634.1 hypothetical protein [Microbacterium sp. HD4P20]
MSPEYDLSAWEGYAIELALAFGDTPTRVRAVRVAYYQQGFDIDLISQASGFPAWRVRQAILAEKPDSGME